MKPTSHSIQLKQLLCSAAILGTASFAHAVDGTWITDLGTSPWLTTTNWAGDIVADGSGSTAFFTNDISADNTVTLSAPQTIGNLVFDDAGDEDDSAWTITGSTLTLAGGTPTITTHTNATIGSNILGTDGLTKAGTGTLTLIGANTYTGGTAINEGVLQIGNGSVNGSLGTGTVSVASGATLRFQQNGTSAAATVPWTTLSGTGTVVFNFGGSGSDATRSLTLGNTTNFTGALVVESGRVANGTGTATFTGVTSLTVKTGGQLGLWNGGNYNQNIFLEGTGYGESGYEVSLRGANNNNGDPIILNLNGLVTLTGNTAVGSRGNGVTNFNNVIGESGGSRNLTFGSAQLGGTVVLNGANTWSGNTTIANGTLVIGGEGSLGAGNYAGNIANAGTLSFATSADQVLTGTISGTGTLNKSGAGTLTLATNSYTGTTNITGGVLSVATLAANGTNSGIGTATTLTLNGGTLRYTGGNYGTDGGDKFNRTITVGANGGTIDLAGTGFLFYGGSLTGSGTLKVIDSNGDANNRQLLVTGNSAAFTGNIEIGNGSANSGWVQYRSNAANPFGTGTITIFTGGILSSDTGSGTPGTLSNNIILSGGTLGVQRAATNFTGSVTATEGTTSFLQTNISGSANLEISGSLLGNGTLEKVGGSHSVLLSGDNSEFSGTYNHTADGATIFFTANSASALASWNIPTGSAANARFMAAASNATYQFGSLSGATGRLENLNASSGNSIFEIGALGTSTSFGGIIQNGGGGTVGITKVGTGTLTLTGANTYTGVTTVEEGTLTAGHANAFGSGKVTFAGGSLTTGAFTVANDVDITGNAAISGSYSGTVDTGTNASRAIDTTGGVSIDELAGQGVFSGGLVTIVGSHTPGNSPGTQTFGSGLAYGNGASLTLEIAANGLTSDFIDITGGGLTIGTGVTLTLNLFGAEDYSTEFWDNNQSFTLISTNSKSGNFLTPTNNLGGAGEGSWTYDWVGNDYVANWTATAVPEPTTALLGSIGVLFLLRRRRA